MNKHTVVNSFLSVLLALSFAVPLASAQPVHSQAASMDPDSSAYQGGRATVYETSPRRAARVSEADSTADILLIQTSDPWENSSHYVGANWYDGVTSDTMVLDSLGYTYQIATWADIDSGSVNIFSYPVVMIVNDQVQAFYDDYALHQSDFESYVASGHVLLFFAAGGGWALGQLNASLPGGVAWNFDYISYNYITDSTHPITTAELSDEIPLSDSDLYSNYCNHGWFSNLPTGARVIFDELPEDQTNPTLMEYPLGKGKVIASTLTWEHNWSYHTGGDGYGTFARKSLDDVFLYAISGGSVATDVSMALRVEDAPSWVQVNKSRGSFIDIAASVSGDAAYNASVTLEVPGDKFGAPTTTFVRTNPYNGGDQSVAYTNLSGGKYQVASALQPLASRYYREFVWRFKIPDDVTPEADLALTATISIPGHTVQKPTDIVSVSIVDHARSLIVTNRTLLFSKYQTDPAKNDVAPLLEELYIQAWVYDGEVFYVDQYSDPAKSWNQVVDYSSEANANSVAKAIDSQIDGWYNRLTKHFLFVETSSPEFLLIVGGDEIIPFYRTDDRPYGDDEYTYVTISNTDPVGKVPQQHYLLTDNLYADVGGGKDDWEKGKLELAVGRIIGHSAKAMLQFMENAELRTPALSKAVLASMAGSQVDTMTTALAETNVAVTGLNNPDMVDNDSWSRADWLTAWQGEWQLNYYGGHGSYNAIPGPNPPGFSSPISTSQLPGGQLATNHPLFIADACNLGLPADGNGGGFDANDNVMWKMESLGIGGQVASTGISSYWGEPLPVLNTPLQAYGERLINDYVNELLDGRRYSEYWGTALLEAKKNYAGGRYGIPGTYDPADKKALMEYVYYGLPWSFMETPENAAAGADRVQAGYDILGSPPSSEAAGSYSNTLTFTVESYSFVRTSEYELLGIPGANMVYSTRKPVLPVMVTTITLPPGSSILSLDLVIEHSTSLGVHSIPAADPMTQYNGSTGYTSTLDVSGEYPSPRFGYDVTEWSDHVEVQVSVFPATFNVDTHETTLYDSTELLLSYAAPVPVSIDLASVDKPRYQVGETVIGNANIRNVSGDAQSLQASMSVYDAAGNLAGATETQSFDVGAGVSQDLQFLWTSELQPGSYRALVILTQNGAPLVASSSSFSVMGGRIAAFVAPSTIAQGEYGAFNVTFSNYSSSSASAKARVYIYDGSGLEVGSLLERSLVVGGHAQASTSWSWDPSGLPVGNYLARAVVTTENGSYGSDLREVRIEPVHYAISGYVLTNSGSALEGVTLNGLPGTPITDSNGHYSGTISSGWSGTVTPTKIGFAFAPHHRHYDNVTNATVDQDYTASVPSVYALYMTENGGTLRTVNQATAETALQGELGTQDIDGLSVRPGDDTYIYAVTFGGFSTPPQLARIDTTTGETTLLPAFDLSELGIPNATAYAIAISPAAPNTAVIAGVAIQNGLQYYIWKIDVDTGAVLGDAIAATSWLQELAYNLDGTVLYGTDSSGRLVTVNAATGSTTVIGDPGLSDYIDGLAFRPSDGALFAIDAYLSDQLVRLDPSNGSVLQVVGPLGVLGPYGLAFVPRYTISGQVRTCSGSGLGAVSMQGLPGERPSDGSGFYWGLVSPGWEGVVAPVKPGYAFWPQGRNYEGVTSDLEIQDFVGGESSIPILVSPEQNHAEQMLRPQFDWSDVAGAARYNIQISNKPTFTTLVKNLAVTASTFTPPTDLPRAVPLYWRVRAQIGGTYRGWSCVGNFNSPNPPLTPALKAPANGSLTRDYTPFLDWSDSAVPITAAYAFDHYELQLATDQTFTADVRTYSTEAGNRLASNYTIPDAEPLTPNRTYYWHVRAQNTGGEYRAWSAARKFRTAIAAPNLVAPAPGVPAGSLRPTFDWADVEGATKYQIQISKSSGFSTVIVQASPVASAFIPAVNLPSGIPLYWRVKALGPNGPSDWSEVRSFSVP